MWEMLFPRIWQANFAVTSVDMLPVLPFAAGKSEIKKYARL